LKALRNAQRREIISVCADQAKEVTVNLHQKGKNLICLRKKEQNAGPKGKLTKCLK